MVALVLGVVFVPAYIIHLVKVAVLGDLLLDRYRIPRRYTIVYGEIIKVSVGLCPKTVTESIAVDMSG